MRSRESSATRSDNRNTSCRQFLISESRKQSHARSRRQRIKPGWRVVRLRLSRVRFHAKAPRRKETVPGVRQALRLCVFASLRETLLACLQLFRDERDDAAWDVDRRLDVARVREVSGHINSAHVRLESLRIINR